MLSSSGFGGLRASFLEASGLYDIMTNLNTFSTQTPRDQQLLGYIKEEWQIKMMAVFSLLFMKRVINFMRNPKLAHILVCCCCNTLSDFDIICGLLELMVATGAAMSYY